MTIDSPMITIKPDPDSIKEDQDDLILSYLNTDYVSTETTHDDDLPPPSSPYSTSSASTDAAHSSMDLDMVSMDQQQQQDPSSLYVQDPFLFHLQTAFQEQGLPLPWPASTAALPTAPFPGGGNGVQDLSCLMNIHPLFIPPTTHYQQPHQQQQQPQQQQQQRQQQQDLQPTLMLSPRSSYSSTNSSSSDSEQSKKKRGGRKKREVSIAPAPIKPLTRILPAANIPTVYSAPPAPPAPAAASPPQCEHIKQEKVKLESSGTSLTPPPLDQIPSPPPPQPQAAVSQTPEKSPAEIAYAKRQERLIKNRAAALLSRKRKREHLTTLEDERQQLVNENQTLHSKVSSLEARVMSLEQENMELKRRLSPSPSTAIQHKQHHHHHHHSSSIATPKHAKTTGMVFMIILFSFALFTLPSSHSPDQLTVGGSPVKPTIALIGSSPSPRMPEIRLDTVPTSGGGGTTTSASSELTPNTTTDLMLIDHVRPGDLQSWIKEKLEQHHHNQETDLVQWRDGIKTAGPHMYLYADQFSQAAPLHQQGSSSPSSMPALEPTLSILCPLNTSSACERPAYLQIDVQVLGSRVLEGALKHAQPDDPLADNDDDSLMFDPIKTDPSTDRRRHHERRRFSRVVLE